MDRSSPRPAPGRTPWGLLGMLGLIVALETAVARRGLDFMATSTSSWVLSARAAEAEAPGRRVLCLGDSLVKHGVLPRLVEDRTGRATYNLSVCAAQSPATYFLLRRALTAGARPEAVVVDFMPDLLAGSPRFSMRSWQEVITLGEALDLAWAARDADFLAEVLLGRLVPTVRSRFEVRAAVRAALRGEDASPRTLTQLHWRNWGRNLGAQVTPKNPAFTGDVPDEMHRRLASHRWWCHRLNASYIRRFLALAKARGICVYWLLPPVSPAVQARREQTGADAGHTRFVRRMQAEFPGLVVLDGRHAGYDHALFVDAVHLDGQGATTLSLDVAEILRHDRPGPADGPAWIRLPAYRPLSAGIALEDVNQSRLALHGRDGGARR
jgi:hypothetical protein